MQSEGDPRMAIKNIFARVKATVLAVFLAATVVFPQSNTWHWVTPQQVDIYGNGNPLSHGHALVYDPDSNRFIVSMGLHLSSACPYPVQMFAPQSGRWINHLPAPELYGIWADSTGNVKGAAIQDYAYFVFKRLAYNGKSYLIPVLTYQEPGSKAYYSYALNSDDGKIYYYLDNRLITYDLKTRLFDTLSPVTTPISGVNTYNNTGLYWQSLCYDRYNKEIIMFGGGGVATDSGHVGMWYFKPSAGVWQKAAASILPPPRAYSPMVYDPVNHKIVLFGGDHLDYLTNDTWVYDCQTGVWQKKNPALSPSPRAGHGLLYMPQSHDIVLVNGYAYSGLGYITIPEVWRYDLTNDRWELIRRMAVTDTFPNKERNKGNRVFGLGFAAAVAVDTGDNIVALGSGDTSGQYGTLGGTFMLHYDGSAPDTAGTSLYGTAQGSIGKRTNDKDPAWYAEGLAPDTALQESLLRNMAPGVWQAFTPPKKPGWTRDWGTIAFDAEKGELQVWGGGHSSGPANDVAHYNTGSNRWSISHAPDLAMGMSFYFIPPGFSFNGRPFIMLHAWDRYDFDANIRKFVLAYNKYTCLYDPDTKEWSKINAPVTGLEIIKNTPHGCVAIPSFSTGGYILKNNPPRWEVLPFKGGGGFRAPSWDGQGLIYDSKRDRLMMFNGSTIVTYSFKDSTIITLPMAVNSYSQNAWFREGVYVPAMDKIFFIDTNQLVTYDVGTQEWAPFSATGASPIQNNRAGGSHACNSQSMEYDAKRNLIWLCNVSFMNVWAIRPDTALTGIEAIVAGKTDLETELAIAPNPFNPIARITVRLPERCDVTLAVYDLNGRLIKMLRTGKANKGSHEFTWRAEGASGFFTVKLTAGDRVFFRRMVLAK